MIYRFTLSGIQCKKEKQKNVDGELQLKLPSLITFFSIKPRAQTEALLFWRCLAFSLPAIAPRGTVQHGLLEKAPVTGLPGSNPSRRRRRNDAGIRCCEPRSPRRVSAGTAGNSGNRERGAVNRRRPSGR